MYTDGAFLPPQGNRPHDTTPITSTMSNVFVLTNGPPESPWNHKIIKTMLLPHVFFEPTLQADCEPSNGPVHMFVGCRGLRPSFFSLRVSASSHSSYSRMGRVAAWRASGASGRRVRLMLPQPVSIAQPRWISPGKGSDAVEMNSLSSKGSSSFIRAMS